MNLPCLAARAWDRFKRSTVATKAFYHGVPIRTLRRNCTVEGVVIRVKGREIDGDVTFDIRLDDGSERHCEVMTACVPGAVRRIAQGMPIGARVRVSGEERFDPAHFGDGGHLGSAGWTEIHPCEQIEVVQWAAKS